MQIKSQWPAWPAVWDQMVTEWYVCVCVCRGGGSGVGLQKP